MWRETKCHVRYFGQAKHLFPGKAKCQWYHIHNVVTLWFRRVNWMQNRCRWISHCWQPLQRCQRVVRLYWVYAFVALRCCWYLFKWLTFKIYLLLPKRGRTTGSPLLGNGPSTPIITQVTYSKSLSFGSRKKRHSEIVGSVNLHLAAYFQL